MPATTRVYLEAGKTWTFACAIDWPGWCRRGRSADEALDALRAYGSRYAVVAGHAFKPGSLDVVARIPGNATTDFGAPSIAGEWDEALLSSAERRRLAGLLENTWRAFDEVVERAPRALRTGPRGGGRDRDVIVEHVREAERTYGRKIGVRVPPRTAWAEQRAAIADAVRHGDSAGAWPARYTVRRIAWHVMDHAWEIEDRTP